MRLKDRPEDFRVNERVDLVYDERGEYFVHRLRKEKLDTHEALAVVAKRARVARQDIAFAGLKDRQAVTDQWITIRGARLDYVGEGIRCRFEGRSALPITSKFSRGNDFTIVIRDLSREDVARAERQLPIVAEQGYVNYFDDQRFSCIKHGQGFIMKSVLEGRYDTALKRLIAVPSPTAIGGDVKLKRILSHYWGDWERCAAISRGPMYRGVFESLQRNPDDFRAALAAVPSRLKLIHAYAYQSLLWNRTVSRLLERRVPRGRQLWTDTIAGSLVQWSRLDPSDLERICDERTPLCGPGGDGGSFEFRKSTERILREAGLTLQAFEDHKVPGMVLREEPRPLSVVPRDLKKIRVERDERNHGSLAMQLRFGLPRGAYATMLVKRLFAQASRRRDDERGRYAPREGARHDDGQRGGGRRDRAPHAGDRRDSAPREGSRRENAPRSDGGRPSGGRPRGGRPGGGRPDEGRGRRRQDAD